MGKAMHNDQMLSDLFQQHTKSWLATWNHLLKYIKLFLVMIMTEVY
jgi:hypothetical protein